MVLVKKLNVVKKIDEARFPEYESKGYKLVTETQPPQENRFACPHCNKDYASEANLLAHIKEKHPETQPPQGGGMEA